MKPILTNGPGIVIGIPTLGRPVPLDWAFAFKALNPPTNYSVNFHLVKGRDVADARNIIAEEAIKKDAKYLFFLGDDVVPPAHALRQLIYRLEQDASIGVVGGVYCAKQDPPDPLVYRGDGQGSYWDWKIGEFFECTGLGMDCTLIRVNALKALSAPYFKTVDTDQFLDGKNNVEAWTEDLWFLKKLRDETTYKVCCDGSVICQHWDVYNNRAYGLPADSLPMRQMVTVKDKKCLMVNGRTEIPTDYDVITFGLEGSDYRGQNGNFPFDESTFDWIIVFDQGLGFSAYIDEYLRVARPGGRISISFQEYIDIEKARNYIAGISWNGNCTFKGPFIEFTKEDKSEKVIRIAS